ncbi:MAG: UDP-N-acetylmuramoylalanyl-D-glutamyl-2, 6-diaminopimelate--D-alanyl-D-alanine ligase [Bdellovibrio sp. CG10_big_fil_rev_8_21_14_0_10_47_8]|nr:MAG: UDP-N-acetylmuramoylalanyl-D-glutamyl-2, 6-diaminopimelate--D-alanyl-D-alanine ligase [Bdellovibrio sp. CG10_big_fil_rev_8_21_14_0_10_47_8]
MTNPRALTVQDIVQATGGKILSQKENLFQGVSTDTRDSMPGKLFIALKGDSFDAHQFLAQAVSQGAAALLVHTPSIPPEILENITVIVVSDTLVALQQLGHFQRRRSKSLVVGITGSNGKTTSKEFSAGLISVYRKVHIPKGSFNNHWGVPLTLLAEPEGTEVSLIEMGMNHAGEIQRLCEIAEPDVVVCSMVGRAHMEHFGSLDKVAEAKEEIYRFAKPEAKRIYNLDNIYTRQMFAKAPQDYPKALDYLSFSSEQAFADVFFQIDHITMSQISLRGTISGIPGEARVPVFGVHNLTNLMVAACVALAADLEPEQIWAALPNCRTNWGRNQLVRLRSGAEMLFDGYNANPDSMKALLENVSLIKSSGKKVGVFAQMLELGDQSATLHEELGEQVGQAGFDWVWFYGPDAEAFQRGMQTSRFKKSLMVSVAYEDSLASKLASVLNLHDTVLVKGSRGMKLERFVMACDPLDFSLNKE